MSSFEFYNKKNLKAAKEWYMLAADNGYELATYVLKEIVSSEK